METGLGIERKLDQKDAAFSLSNADPMKSKPTKNSRRNIFPPGAFFD